MVAVRKMRSSWIWEIYFDTRAFLCQNIYRHPVKITGFSEGLDMDARERKGNE